MEHLLPEWARDSFSIESVEVNGQTVPFLVGGTGEPVVLIHGLSASLDWWRFNAPALARTFRVYLIDLPGYGWLGHLDTADSMTDYVAWVCSWMDAVGLSSVDLIGHSMGGHIAVRLAVSNPERVRRLVLIAPAGTLPSTSFSRYVALVLKTIYQIPRTLLRVALRDLYRTNLRTAFRSGRNLLQQRVLGILDQVRAKTLIVWGTEDAMVPHSHAGEFVERIPNVELELVEGAGHLPMVDDPERINQRVIEFLSDDTA